ncbi:MAG: hypothetical protein J7484_11700 [Microbacterium sp.]|nr:hypothetical protein [Microbacterium sp.]
MSTSARTLSIAAGALAVLAALAGCATVPGAAPAGGSPKIGADKAPRAAWLDPSSFVISTWSDGCAPMIDDLVVGDQRIEVSLTTADEATCDGEEGPYGTYLGVPAGIDSSKPLTIEVTQYGGEASLIELAGLANGEVAPADRMPEQKPAAAWIGDGELAVLTWGSSTCLPKSGAVADGVITLDEPLDGVCTMDYVPRITFVSAAGVAEGDELELAGYTAEDGTPMRLAPVPLS